MADTGAVPAGMIGESPGFRERFATDFPTGAIMSDRSQSRRGWVLHSQWGLRSAVLHLYTCTLYRPGIAVPVYPISTHVRMYTLIYSPAGTETIIS
jgi:hypothetical protein